MAEDTKRRGRRIVLSRCCRGARPCNDLDSRQIVYNAAGQKIADVDELGNRTTYTFDGSGRMDTVRDARSNVTTTLEFSSTGVKIDQGSPTWDTWSPSHLLSLARHPRNQAQESLKEGDQLGKDSLLFLAVSSVS